MTLSAGGRPIPRGSGSPPLAPTGDQKVDAYRKEYRSYRRGHAKGAKGEVGDLARDVRKVALTVEQPGLPARGERGHRRTGSMDSSAERSSSYNNLGSLQLRSQSQAAAKR